MEYQKTDLFQLQKAKYLFYLIWNLFITNMLFYMDVMSEWAYVSLQWDVLVHLQVTESVYVSYLFWECSEVNYVICSASWDFFLFKLLFPHWKGIILMII